jgi:ATP-binding cassette, subfamily B, bacterial HlyB/CyaB
MVNTPDKETDNGSCGISDALTAPVLDTGLICLALLVRFHGIAVEEEALRHRRGRGGAGLDPNDMIILARELGLKAKLLRSDATRLQKTPLPAIALKKDGSSVILAKFNTEKQEVLLHDPALARPITMPHDEFLEMWSGKLILVARRAGAVEALRNFDIRWFLTTMVKYRWLLAEVLLASFFLQLFGLVSPIFFQVVIDKVLVHRGLTTLDVLVFGLATIGCFEALLGALRTYVFSHTTNRIDVILGARLFRHLLALPLAYFGARRVGDSVARVRELDNIREFITGSALTLVIDTLFTGVFLAVMAVYSIPLTGVVLLSIPCFIILSVTVTPLLRQRVQERFVRRAENQAFLVESVTSVETVKAMAVEPQLQRRWEEQLAAYVGASFKAANLNANAGQVAQLISKLTNAAVLWFGAHAVIDGSMTVGELVAFNMLANRVTSPVLRLAQLWQDFQQASISIERLGDILNTMPEPHSAAGASLPKITGEIRFDNMTFRYRPDCQPALQNIAFTIAPGQVVGVVGPSGSGKSTLGKLVQRLYVPEAGRILVDGIDLSLADPAWLRRQIGVVLQENTLFNLSIRENIALIDTGMPLERIIAAAKLAGAHEFIVALPNGYDTVVGERGASLSGGQRQRIAIARALVGDPRILIFDEATSALDYESEYAIQQNMRSICRGRTVIIIAHRLAALRYADRILTIEGGRLVEDGTQEELLRQGGRYAKLSRMQSGEVQDEAA